ncbi:NAD-dependent succinate-semialdehyde dehydrogenase [Fulvivirga sp. RKSG066]|uniref:NAD-dependent succinate-semialdehyde dehydrogenase n=1 Tax=Fulvivirga aurantia TaxID=2529383 RepID=UPI0012BD1E26|nr:NAD-dependent succinate-semialdehyde dehydrogenase [Fulvivirga aurantia]MTI21331.1 NAD-dependent succinate-semialdehyde dehydrogenase [Fulvivirga aurantia]
MIQVINPATGEHLRTYDELSPEKVSEIIDDVNEAWYSWKEVSFDERAAHMMELSRLIKKDKERLARLMTEEMGKVYSQGISEAEKCAWVCEYYAQNAQEFLKNEPKESDASNSYVAFRPLGLVLAIMPWNFPFWQVMRFAAPALMAGNVGILKHASNVPGCAAAIEELIKRAGFPENVFRNLHVGSDQIEDIIANEKVKAVTLTGSTPAGKSVAAYAGKNLKKTVLELGGSDPYIILEDADLDLAIEKCVTSRLINNGQSCIAAKRFIVVESIADEFEKRMVEAMEAKNMGDPELEGTDLGPMSRKDLREELHEQVKESVEKGAKLLLGGEIPESDGFFYPATILTNVPKAAPAYSQELFGPVASIIRVQDLEKAIEVANDTEFGLGAGIFTKDEEKGREIAETRLEAGCCFVNDFVKSDPRLPFGGIKGSGYGRELSSFGIREFVNTKTVYVA